MTIESIISYCRRIRDLQRAGPTNVEQALAPSFQRLLEEVLPSLAADLAVIPEFARAGVGRPDIALRRAGQQPRAFVELKAPEKPRDPERYRDQHDKKQFERFQSLPVWAISNFWSIRSYRRDEMIGSVDFVPADALKPETTDARADRLIRSNFDEAQFLDLLRPLALADPPVSRNPEELASNLAQASRLVRNIVADRLAELSASRVVNAPLQAVRDEFREVLYAHPQAGGYSSTEFDPLFASAFAQTLAFGLLLVREATGTEVAADAWQHMPAEHALMRTTLRVLSMEEIVRDVGVGFDVIMDTVNSFDPAILARRIGQPDPILYFYEDYLQVFDSAARERYGILYYTPVDVVRYMVAALDRSLRENLGTAGLADDEVTLLDPATGTGTFLLGVIEHVRATVENTTGPGAVPGALRALAGRLFGFELLVGPYAVAHYRLRHAIGALQPNHRIGVFLADTLSEPGAAAPAGRLGFVA